MRQSGHGIQRVFLCAATLFMLTASSGAAHPPMPPDKLNLRLADLPEGFVLTSHRFWTNAQEERVDHLSPATIAREGRILSHEEQFEADGLVGLLSVDATVVAYKTAHGASLAYARSTKAAAKGMKGWRAMAVGAIGDLAYGYQRADKANGISVVVDFLLFRRENYIVIYSAGGVANTFTAHQALAPAHVIDARIIAKG